MTEIDWSNPTYSWSDELADGSGPGWFVYHPWPNERPYPSPGEIIARIASVAPKASPDSVELCRAGMYWSVPASPAERADREQLRELLDRYQGTSKSTPPGLLREVRERGIR